MKIQHFEEITKASKREKKRKRKREIAQPKNKKKKPGRGGNTREKRSSHPQNLEERGCFTHPT